MRFFRHTGNRKGFTMIELMVVVVIVGVLAAIAIPLYGKYIRNARVTEATGRMGEIITSCKAWAQEHDIAGVPQWPTVAGGIVDLTSTESFSYGIVATQPATTGSLVVTATGRAAPGKMFGVTVVITVPNISATGLPPVITGL